MINQYKGYIYIYITYYIWVKYSFNGHILFPQRSHFWELLLFFYLKGSKIIILAGSYFSVCVGCLWYCSVCKLTSLNKKKMFAYALKKRERTCEAAASEGGNHEQTN